VIGVFDHENDVEFNKNLSLNVTHGECGNNNDEDINLSANGDGSSSKNNYDLKKINCMSENVQNNKAIHSNFNKIHEEKNILLLRSIFLNRPKVIFFQ